MERARIVLPIVRLALSCKLKNCTKRRIYQNMAFGTKTVQRAVNLMNGWLNGYQNPKRKKFWTPLQGVRDHPTLSSSKHVGHRISGKRKISRKPWKSCA